MMRKIYQAVNASVVQKEFIEDWKEKPDGWFFSAKEALEGYNPANGPEPVQTAPADSAPAPARRGRPPKA